MNCPTDDKSNGSPNQPIDIAMADTSMLRINLIGGIQVSNGTELLKLPPSRKARALLAYLVLNPRPQRRDWLCELLWEIPDDPRGALRWALSLLRSAINSRNTYYVAADRERAWINPDHIVSDIFEFRRLADLGSDADFDDLCSAAIKLREPLMAGLDIPQQTSFAMWIAAERSGAETLRRRILSVLASTSAPAGSVITWAKEWVELEPLEGAPTRALMAAFGRAGRHAEAQAAARRYQVETAAAGLTPEPVGLAAVSQSVAAAPLGLGAKPLDRQKIDFCTAHDDARIAYATVGDGPPLLKAANWLNHLELDWDAPIWAPLFRELAQDYCFTRYDGRGNGLSDWSIGDLSFDAMVSDLEAVVAAKGLDRFPLLGISQGCAVAIEYAARHPAKVSHLILWGGYAAGWRVDATAETIAEREAIITLVRQGWGRENPIYRRLFSSTFMPTATDNEMNWFDEFQRRTTSSANAARFLEVFAEIDVRHRLRAVQAPTLVMHANGDRRIPVSSSGYIAANIEGAEFVALESDNHILLGREPASAEFLMHVRDFLDRNR